MCGIAGYAGLPPDAELARRMADVIRHRGPDDEGFHLDEHVTLAMRRLAIIDVATGRQPIANEDGAVVVVMNGEIYNYRELARGLLERGHRLTTRSDTETLVHLYEEHGIAFLEKLRGMFALALLDRRTGTLFLARDRIGLKPLYVHESRGRLVFGSEMKSILVHPWVPREPHLPSIDRYLGLRYVPGPDTMFAGIRKLPPGHWLSWQAGEVRTERWWAPPVGRPPYRSEAECRELFPPLLAETVRLHLESDVPVGSYLSGGLDSSLVTAEARAITGKPLQTFAVGFGWEGDETDAARDVAQALGCEHHEVVCRPEDLSLLAQVVWHADEPLGDPIALPTFLLSRAARDHTKVVLTGEGADEVLAGYLFHRVLDLTHRVRPFVPGAVLRSLAAPLARRLPVKLLSLLFDYPASLGRAGRRRLGTYVERAADDDPAALYDLLIRLFDQGDRKAIAAAGSAFEAAIGPTVRAVDPDAGPGAAPGGGVRDAPWFERMLHAQFATWLPDNILTRQDKMAMAHGVETRIPFLDHQLVEFLATVPPSLKLRSLAGQNKILARERAAHLLAAPVAARRKKPFYIPTERYFTTPVFRDLVARTLDPERVRRRGYFDPAAVTRLVDDARANPEFVTTKQVLALVMLELWHEMFIDDFRAPGA